MRSLLTMTAVVACMALLRGTIGLVVIRRPDPRDESVSVADRGSPVVSWRWRRLRDGIG